nr:hypothetical protein [Tanacetum cinerariifolium]
AAKRRKLSEEAQEADDLTKRLEIIQDEDDDVFVEVTPLAQKVPVVDYQIVVIDNKPKYKIIRADDTYQFYISFTTLLKNFDREDLETLWKIVKRWKLLTLCGVHVILLSTVQLFLLVERRYPFSRFTLEQLVNVARLQVQKESEMSLELLRLKLKLFKDAAVVAHAKKIVTILFNLTVLSALRRSGNENKQAGEKDERELFEIGESRGDLLKDDIEILRRSKRFRREDVIEMEKNVIHIYRSFENGMVLENEDSKKCFV